MELSCKIEYALLALMELAGQYNRRKSLTVSEIAARHQIPDRYLEQILTGLRRKGIVQSQRGAKGGYVLARAPWQITLLEIVATDAGENGSNGQTDAQGVTLERILLKEVWQQAEQAAQTVLEHYTLQDLCLRRDNYQQSHPMYYI